MTTTDTIAAPMAPETFRDLMDYYRGMEPGTQLSEESVYLWCIYTGKAPNISRKDIRRAVKTKKLKNVNTYTDPNTRLTKINKKRQQFRVSQVQAWLRERGNQ